MRQVKLMFFKPSGKYYTDEIREFNRSLQVYEIIEEIEDYEKSYKGMHIVLEFDKDDDIGYPCMILANNRSPLNQ